MDNKNKSWVAQVLLGVLVVAGGASYLGVSIDRWVADHEKKAVVVEKVEVVPEGYYACKGSFPVVIIPNLPDTTTNLAVVPGYPVLFRVTRPSLLKVGAGSVVIGGGEILNGPVTREVSPGPYNLSTEDNLSTVTLIAASQAGPNREDAPMLRRIDDPPPMRPLSL